jgi:CHC2 zinc finger
MHNRRPFLSILDVARMYGAKLQRVGVEWVGPCIVCGGTDRFGVNVAKGVWNCRGCTAGGDVIELVKHVESVGYREAVERLNGESPIAARPLRRPRPVIDSANYEKKQHRKAAWMWSRRRPIIGSPVERYLREARGYGGPTPATLAFLPPSKPEHHPAMIAAFGVPDEAESGVLGEPRYVDTVHLTLLKPDGIGKAAVAHPKIVVGRPLGRPIVLAPANDLLGLAITEGIEDGLSVHMATGLGVWAAGNAPLMPSLAAAIGDCIDCATIFAHDDRGKPHAIKLADALTERGFEVFVEGVA